jgi:hypothetical protein
MTSVGFHKLFDYMAPLFAWFQLNPKTEHYSLKRKMGFEIVKKRKKKKKGGYGKSTISGSHSSKSETVMVYYLKSAKRLPPEPERNGPNDERSDRVKHHARRGRHLLRHAHSGKVEEGNAHNRS